MLSARRRFTLNDGNNDDEEGNDGNNYDEDEGNDGNNDEEEEGNDGNNDDEEEGNDGNNDDEEGNNGDKEDNEDDEKDSGHELLKKIAIYFQKMGRGVKGCSEYLRKFIKFLEDLVR